MVMPKLAVFGQTHEVGQLSSRCNFAVAKNARQNIANRTIFQHCAHIGKAINADVLKPHTFPKPQKMTAYNRMIQIDKDMFDDKAWDQAKLRIFDGSLFNPGITSATIEGEGTSAAAVRAAFTAAAEGGNDKAIAIIHDEKMESTLSAIATNGPSCKPPPPQV
jgi:hypothetical protein